MPVIGELLRFLRLHLDAQLRMAYGGGVGDGQGDRVVFVDGDKFEPISFKLNAVSLLLLNVEEDRAFRRPDPYRATLPSGETQSVMPEVRLILYVLFVSRFKEYDVAWSHLSKILEYFQHERALDRENAPSMPDSVEKLVFELITLSFADQNEVWNALRTTHHPSILYRVKLLALQDRKPTTPPVVGEAQRVLAQLRPGGQE